jgi:hypothetical protein
MPTQGAWRKSGGEKSGLSLARRLGRTLVYPNEVVEKKIGVSATTRNWNTLSAICQIVKGK